MDSTITQRELKNNQITQATHIGNTCNEVVISDHSSGSTVNVKMTDMSWLAKLTSETIWETDKKKDLM